MSQFKAIDIQPEGSPLHVILQPQEIDERGALRCEVCCTIQYTSGHFIYEYRYLSFAHEMVAKFGAQLAAVAAGTTSEARLADTRGHFTLMLLQEGQQVFVSLSVFEPLSGDAEARLGFHGRIGDEFVRALRAQWDEHAGMR